MRKPLPTLVSCLVIAVAFAAAGCGGKKAPPKVAVAPKYQPLPKREAPGWLANSLFEQVDLMATEPFRVSSYGLVTLKRPTGDAMTAPNNVREYMIREMVKRGFGSKNQAGFEQLSPEFVLRDPRVAIVRVDGFIPAGAVKGQRMDVQVSALEDSNTTSLAGGSLFLCDLMPNGANPSNPGGIEVMANARGYVFVNPAYALDSNPNDMTHRRALTTGIVLNGGRVNRDRPLGLRIRAAERRLARMTEYRIDEMFANSDTAKAMDEGVVFVNVPGKYRGDWEHFAGLLMHTYYSNDQSFAALKARELAAEAQKPDAPLLDISYTMEALGRAALPEIEPLLTHPKHDVAFAAARAAAWIGDTSAEAALAAMAADPANQFRTNAAQVLTALPSTPAINSYLRELLKTRDPLVRIEAYRGLVRNDDTSIYSKRIGDKFMLDIVTAPGPAIVYASRTGNPRIAFIGSTARLAQPTFFSAMNNEFSISDADQRKDLLTLFYRGAGVRDPVKQLTTPDLAEIVARLGGEGTPGQPQLDFSYGEIIAILGKLADGGALIASGDNLGTAKASFILQEAPGWNRDVNSAPVIPEGPRPIDTTQTPQATAQ